MQRAHPGLASEQFARPEGGFVWGPSQQPAGSLVHGSKVLLATDRARTAVLGVYCESCKMMKNVTVAGI